jgi:hypothetical protein
MWNWLTVLALILWYIGILNLGVVLGSFGKGGFTPALISRSARGTRSLAILCSAAATIIFSLNDNAIRSVSSTISLYIPLGALLVTFVYFRWTVTGSWFPFGANMARIGMITDMGFILLDFPDEFHDIAKIGDFLTEGYDDRTRHAAVCALAKSDDRRAFDYLAPALADSNSKTQNAAIAAITMVGNRLSQINQFRPDDANRLLIAVDRLLQEEKADTHVKWLARKLRDGLVVALERDKERQKHRSQKHSEGIGESEE